VLQHPQLSGQYQLVVDREGPLDTLRVRTELNNASAQASPADIEQIVHWLQHRIKTLVGVSTRIDVLRPDSIERTLTGKARRVVDQRQR
jgi:phenylacetate-CoA ligase